MDYDNIAHINIYLSFHGAVWEIRQYTQAGKRNEMKL